MTCYVYIWFRPNGIPLYVGWGKHRSKRKPRWADHIYRSHNRHLAAAFRKYGSDLPIVIVRDNLTLSEAKATETAFIKAIGRSDLRLGPLANQTDGGDGAVNVSEEARRKVSVANRGRRHGPCPPERRAKISAATVGRIKTESERAAISRANRGRIRSQEFKNKVSVGMKRRYAEYGGQTLGKTLSEEARTNIGNGSRGRRRSPETRQRLREAAIKRMQDPAQRYLLSERAKQAWADHEIRTRQLIAIRDTHREEDMLLADPNGGADA